MSYPESWRKNASVEALNLCYHADKEREKIIWNEKIGFRTLFFFFFFSFVLEPTNKTRDMHIKPTSLGQSWDLQLSDHVWHCSVSSNSFGEIWLWTQPCNIYFPKFLLNLVFFLVSNIIFTKLWSMLPMHIIHGWKAVHVS